MEEAERLFQECEFEKSLEYLSSLSPLAKHKMLIHKLRAKNYIELNKLDLAIASIDSYIRKLPSKSEGHIIKARIYIMTGKFSEALYELEKSSVAEEIAQTYYLKAYALTKLNQLEEASRLYEKCLSKSQYYSPLTFLGKADTLVRMNQIEESRKYIEYARKALNDGNSEKTLIKSDKSRIDLCLSKYDELEEMLNELIINQPKLEKKIQKTRANIQRDFFKKINETVFLKKQQIIEAVAKKHKKYINVEFDLDEAETNDTLSIFSCCFSQHQHTC